MSVLARMTPAPGPDFAPILGGSDTSTMTTELNAACDKLGWDATVLADNCVMGEDLAKAMLAGQRPVWDEVSEEVLRQIAMQWSAGNSISKD